MVEQTFEEFMREHVQVIVVSVPPPLKRTEPVGCDCADASHEEHPEEPAE